MAIKLNATYAKRLGLPGYSSHQFSVSIETELVTTDDVAQEAARIYRLLQTNVDEQIQATGFVPAADYGAHDSEASAAPGGTASPPQNAESWRCSDKQRDLILKLVDEHSLDKNEVDHLARQRFGKGVRQLNKIEASGLIDELLDTHAGSSRHDPGKGTPNRRHGSAYSRNGRRDAA